MEARNIIHGGIATGGSKTTLIDALIDFPADAVKDKYVKVALGAKTIFRKITTNSANTLTFLTLGDAAAATAAVKAASAVTDTLTVTIPSAIGRYGNGIKVELVTAEDDNLAVTKDDSAEKITISLAKTTASKNTATLIQAAIRALVHVANIPMTAVTCTAGGNWNTAAIATGETAAVQFSGGADEIAAKQGTWYEILSI